MSKQPPDSFEKAVRKKSRPGLISDLWHFLRTTKKWWLLPIIVFSLTLGLIMLASGTAVAPFIYTLF